MRQIINGRMYDTATAIRRPWLIISARCSRNSIMRDLSMQSKSCRKTVIIITGGKYYERVCKYANHGSHRRPQYSGRSVISIKQKKSCF